MRYRCCDFSHIERWILFKHSLTGNILSSNKIFFTKIRPRGKSSYNNKNLSSMLRERKRERERERERKRALLFSTYLCVFSYIYPYLLVSTIVVPKLCVNYIVGTLVPFINKTQVLSKGTEILRWNRYSCISCFLKSTGLFNLIIFLTLFLTHSDIILLP